MTKFYFLRHAQATHNITPDLIGGRCNEAPLTEAGVSQAQRLGRLLRQKEMSFDAVFTSGAVRTNQTAEQVFNELGSQPYETDERLLEVSQGPWEGATRKDVYTEEVVDLYHLNELDGALPGAESIIEAQQRMVGFMREKATIGDKSLLVISHGLAIRSLVGHIEQLSKPAILAIETPNVSVTRIDFNDQAIVQYVGKELENG